MNTCQWCVAVNTCHLCIPRNMHPLYDWYCESGQTSDNVILMCLPCSANTNLKEIFTTAGEGTWMLRTERGRILLANWHNNTPSFRDSGKLSGKVTFNLFSIVYWKVNKSKSLDVCGFKYSWFRIQEAHGPGFLNRLNKHAVCVLKESIKVQNSLFWGDLTVQPPPSYGPLVGVE